MYQGDGRRGLLRGGGGGGLLLLLLPLLYISCLCAESRPDVCEERSGGAGARA